MSFQFRATLLTRKTCIRLGQLHDRRVGRRTPSATYALFPESIVRSAFDTTGSIRYGPSRRRPIRLSLFGVLLNTSCH